MILQERVENLEKAQDAQESDTRFARSYGFLTALFTVLTLLPYTEDSTFWEIPTGSSYAPTFALVTMVPLLFLLLCSVVRPVRSRFFGWYVAGLSLLMAILTWITLADTSAPTASAHGLVIVCFALTLLGALHARYHHRQWLADT